MKETPVPQALDTALGQIWTDSSIVDDFEAICSCGGRLAGTDSEAQAQAYLDQRLNEIPGTRHDYVFDYTGWQPEDARLRLLGPSDRELSAVALPGSPPVTGAEVEMIDLGAGTEGEFAAASKDIAGKAVLVRHEYPFTTGHTHRRYKYQWACDAEAAAFIIANNNPMGGAVTGGSGSGLETDIPALGVSHDVGEELRTAAARGQNRLALTVSSQQSTWPARNLILDLPGKTDEWVVLCAHIDGHNLAESAMDNATGLATVLEVGRRLAPLIASCTRGLRLAMFTVEEWGLEGSRRYVEQLSDQNRNRIRAAIALDSLTGHPRLSALTGGNADMERLVGGFSASTGVAIDVVRPVLANSDHYSFQRADVPAMRLIAGYGREDSLTRYLLTPADTRALVDTSQLKAAALTTAALVHSACQ